MGRNGSGWRGGLGSPVPDGGEEDELEQGRDDSDSLAQVLAVLLHNHHDPLVARDLLCELVLGQLIMPNLLTIHDRCTQQHL